MADQYKLDSHKLIYHPLRVADWLNGKTIFPIYMEISPIGLCNHRCVFCSVDYMGYQNRHLETKRLKEIISELGKGGLKSIMYAGEGEPFLHRDMAEITEYAKQCGIDNAFTTNGSLMTPEISERILPVTEWIKVSCNAGTPENYSQMHRTGPGEFDKVLKNLKYAVDLRRRKGYSCVLGIQSVLLRENMHTIENLAAAAKEIGLDYYVVKPYMPHRLNAHHFEIDYHECQELAERLKHYNTPDFSVVFRTQAMERHDCARKNYGTCYSLPFWSYLDSGGNIWGCSVHLTEEKYIFGNIYDQSFSEIWDGEKRTAFMKEFLQNPLPETCKVNCRMDAVNEYLWNLKNPVRHVNFI